MSSTNEVIRLENVQKIYDLGKVKVEAVRGISLTIHKGEFVGIEGPSGSGKSTLLNMVGCLDVPTKGEIYLNDKKVSSLSESNLATIRGRRIGFIFQQFNLIPTLTALENVTLPMVFQGYGSVQRIKRGRELLRKVELEERMNHKPSELSGGQQQRVAIARALANNPSMILADEPTGNLDSKTGKHVMSLLNKLNDDGITIVMVTHDPISAKHAKRVFYLKDGQLCDKEAIFKE
jgi:putative ABC transport system ATP-binding protein